MLNHNCLTTFSSASMITDHLHTVTLQMTVFQPPLKPEVPSDEVFAHRIWEVMCITSKLFT
jgi:hypothetical protein